ncbi:hypothetical protein BSR28_02145 [Boudabousia liubingyangii]|nr:hypothetical protein [Boudabousia liubingyangii]OKL48512.1 hypothetical protein BSR28_02145 [Boudabousia liubingyangii]
MPRSVNYLGALIFGIWVAFTVFFLINDAPISFESVATATSNVNTTTLIPGSLVGGLASFYTLRLWQNPSQELIKTLRPQKQLKVLTQPGFQLAT